MRHPVLMYFIGWRFQRTRGLTICTGSHLYRFPIYFFLKTAYVDQLLFSDWSYFRIKKSFNLRSRIKRIKQKYVFLVCNSLYCKQNWNDLPIHTTYSLSVSLPPLENNSFHFLSLGAGTVLRNFPVEMCIILSNLLLVYCVGKFDHVQCPN